MVSDGCLVWISCSLQLFTGLILLKVFIVKEWIISSLLYWKHVQQCTMPFLCVTQRLVLVCNTEWLSMLQKVSPKRSRDYTLNILWVEAHTVQYMCLGLNVHRILTWLLPCVEDVNRVKNKVKLIIAWRS